MKRCLAMMAMPVLMGLSPGAQAALLAACSVQPSALAFPAYDLSRPGPTDSQSSVTLGCLALGGIPGSVVYQISLSRSTTNASFSRQLARGASRLNYNLFADPSRTQVWGDGSSGTTRVGGSISFVVLGLTLNATHQVYARMPAGQAVAGGSYSDRVTVTVDF